MTTPTALVPDGHEVRVLGRSIDPIVDRIPGGLLVARTGLGGDNQLAEVTTLLADLTKQIAPHPVTINTDAGFIDELFAPNEPSTRTLDSAAVLYFQAGSLAGWTGDALARLAIEVRALEHRTDLFVFLDPTADVMRLAPLLASPRAPTADGKLGAEVRRPDGRFVTGLVASSPPDTIDPEPPLLARSPRLDALVLALLDEPTAESKRALDDHLTARTQPLAMIATKNTNGDFGVEARQWPGKQALVAYGNERSLHRAANELGLKPGHYAVAALPPPKLFAWAISRELPVAICAFDDRDTHTAWHAALEVDDLRRLAP